MISWIAGAASLAIIGTIAVVAAGYDARETPREEPSVWAMRSAGQYARVNTLTAEIDTVRKVDEPSGVVQAGAGGLVLTHGNGRAWSIDPSLPGNLLDETDESAEQTAPDDAGEGSETAPVAQTDVTADSNDDPDGTAEFDALRTPDGTRDVVSAGEGVLFRTENGAVYLSVFERAVAGGPLELGPPRQLDPLADETADAADGEEPRAYAADAVAIDADGRVAMFSAAEQAVRWADVTRGVVTDTVSAVPEGFAAEEPQLAIVAGEWVLFDAESGLLWREGSAEPVQLPVEGAALLQASSSPDAGTAGATPDARDSDVLVADEAGLWVVAAGEAERVESFTGVPAQPIEVGGARYAAWLGLDSGRLWSSQGEGIPLELDQTVTMPGDPEPVIRTSGTSGILSEVKTGMLWTLPAGELIPVEQWTLADPPRDRDGTVVVTDVTEQEPPVAVADEFGVRAGEPAPLPVLLNDYDPNRRDVLTIVPDGLGGELPESFGTVSMLADAQSLVVHPAPDATGSATFRYRITDGVLVSEPATVTLTVQGAEVETAPQWCPVQGCQREWPSPELAPGGTLVLPILEGWVDPEGDPMMLEAAEPVNPADPVRALVTADGRFALRHTDPNAGDSEVAVQVTVADARGERTERELRVQVRSNAKAEMALIASTVQVDQTTSLRPLTRIVGGSGSTALVDASVQSGTATATVNAGTGTIDVTAREPGTTLIAVTARDTGTDAEVTGTIRVTAVESRPKLGLPPLRAFVRPLADTTIDVLDAVPGANSRALVVRSAAVVDGELSADVIEHARVRVSGSTADGEPGRIGAADLTIAEGSDVAVGRLTVFQVPETGLTGAIAVADSVTVRAGAVTDIPVLENDVAPPGQRLVLHPEVSGSGTKGELAFASGNTLRYLAPSEPGTYTLTYTTYSASSPEASDVGQVRVTVLPREGNRDPQPRTLTVRLSPGERATASVPLSGVDPDGDRVRLVGVSAPADSPVSATLAPRSSAIEVEASRTAEPGQVIVPYTVRDEFGGSAEGRLRVIVTEPDPGGGAPVTYSDYVRLVQDATEPAVVMPLENDIDPLNGELELIEVVPNVPGGSDSPQYRALAQRLDTSELDEGRVSITGGGELGTVSYRYTVRSTASSSTADGLIVVQVSARVGQQAPTVVDTVLSARDRGELERGGVDVVTDRVHWAAGDVRSLEMSLWGGAADRYTTDGNRIIGKYRAEGDLVAFKLAGVDLTGAEVESFGFLVIPPLDELRLTLRPGFSGLTVEEGESVRAQLADVVDLATGDVAEFRQGSFPTQRGQASCEARGGTLTYSAGKEAPWADTCVVSVKLTEQTAWTQLAVPVVIVPDEPVVELQTVTRTVAPGASETIDLTDMVRWEGGREGRVGDLAFSVSGGGGNFDVAPNGQRVTVEAHADAVPGGQDTLIVGVRGAGESQAPLTLRVGTAPRDTPRGATVNLTCTVGSTCQTQLIGAPGEYDPFQGKTGGGLTLDSVRGAGCAVATFQASGDAVSIGWPNGAQGAGGRCTGTFTVSDAQGRTGQGVIELDAQGVPRPPTGITQTGYTKDSVMLSVSLSGTDSHPGVTGVRVLQDGGSSGATCTGSGSQYSCVVSGLRNGQQHSFTAVAVNSVGDSDPTANAVTAWAYDPPKAPRVTPTQASAESAETGTVRFEINGTAGTSGYRLITERGELSVSGRNSSANVAGLPVGSTEYRVIPLTAFTPPDGAPAQRSETRGNVTVSGRPVVSVEFVSSDVGSDTASVRVTVDSRGTEGAHHFGVSSDGGCDLTETGRDGTVEVTGTAYQQLTVTACAENKWGRGEPVSIVIDVGGTPPQPTVDPLGWTIGPAPSIGGGLATYSLSSAPTVTAADGHTLDFRVNGATVGGSFPTTVEAGNTYTVVQCMNGVCSEPVVLSGNVPGAVTVDLSGCLPSTVSEQELRARISPHARSSATVTFDHATGTFNVLWGGSYSSLMTLDATVCTIPDPEPEPDPEPDPDPGPGEGDPDPEPGTP
ncbi:MAG: Ig-like domain-containing protein [Leucobacter sp.]